MSDATLRGRFVWHELMTNDVKAAGTFYKKVAGWKTRGWKQDSSYTELVAGDRPSAGLMALPDEAKAMGAPPNWLVYIGAPDIEATAREAVGLGGKVLKAPSEIPTIGKYVVLQDPQGATFAVFSPKQAPTGPEPAPAVGGFSWHELATTDAAGALAFYQRLFGWEKTNSMDMGPDLGVYQMFGIGGRQQGGIFTRPKQMQGPVAWLSYVRVPDAKKSPDAIKKAGGQVINGPQEVPGGDWIVQAIDPQGVMFAVHSVAAAPAKQPAKPTASVRSTVKAKRAKATSAVKASRTANVKKAAKRPAARARKPAKKAAARKRR
jgi:predicted enzyme related to lactoylglutathione lyase